MSSYIDDDTSDDGIDRRGFLKCMAWAGTGMLWAIDGGVLSSTAIERVGRLAADPHRGELLFVQISDSHIGFDKAANHDVTATLQQAIAHSMPVPAQAMHLRKPRRSMPSSLVSSSM